MGARYGQGRKLFDEGEVGQSLSVQQKSGCQWVDNGN